MSEPWEAHLERTETHINSKFGTIYLNPDFMLHNNEKTIDLFLEDLNSSKQELTKNSRVFIGDMDLTTYFKDKTEKDETYGFPFQQYLKQATLEHQIFNSPDSARSVLSDEDCSSKPYETSILKLILRPHETYTPGDKILRTSIKGIDALCKLSEETKIIKYDEEYDEKCAYFVSISGMKFLVHETLEPQPQIIGISFLDYKTQQDDDFAGSNNFDTVYVQKKGKNKKPKPVQDTSNNFSSKQKKTKNHEQNTEKSGEKSHKVEDVIKSYSGAKSFKVNITQN
ncbi:MAG: hypothetical protein ACP5N3_05610 [Candidatus Nanoarchaeia archaeon]